MRKNVFIFAVIAKIFLFAQCNKDEAPDLAPVVATPTISVESPSADDDVVITVQVTDDNSVKSVKLFYFLDDGDANELTMTSLDSIYTATIPKQNNFVEVSFYIEATDDADKTTLTPSDAPSSKYGYIVGADAVLITINELICKDDLAPYYTDEEGGGTDWIELYNGGINAVDVAGMYLTDEPTTEWQQIPATNSAVTTIQPGGFLVLIVGAKDVDGVKIPTSISNDLVFIEMGLKSSSTDNLTLYDTDQATMLDQSGDIPDDLADESSYGKTTDGGSTWQAIDTPTPGATNGSK